jgi:beta-galactosidase
MKQQGVAGYNSWGARPLPEYTLPANREYRWGFTLIPLDDLRETREKALWSY